MAKLYFNYGTMGSGKSLELIRTYYNYKEKDLCVYCFTSGMDTRSEMDRVESRTGESIKAKVINPEDIVNQLFKDYKKDNCKIILIDESQFLSEKQIEDIKMFTMREDISVICYGLKTNFTSKLFEGSKRLVELADVQREIIGICWCGKKATQNARLLNGEITYKGEEIQVGGNESYIALCYNHYKKGEIAEKKMICL